ncbi:MAG: hypothetical protein LUD57_05440 [Ruminococcus sp.]|nr:hypothetical protein [Ruminococcus sp.]MCD8188043.1 hypothetical protein [Ruminococcus sp.]
MKDISYRVALGGIISALCLVTMFLAGVIPALYLVLPMIAGVLMMIIAVEVNKKWALLTYVAVGMLSMFITFDKEAALIFIMFFGHYPILRFYIERIKPALIRLLIKFAVFNVCIIAYFYVTVYIFGLVQMLEEMDEFGKYGTLIMLVFANFVFVLYDYNLDVCYKLYRKKIMPKFHNGR